MIAIAAEQRDTQFSNGHVFDSRLVLVRPALVAQW